MTAAEQVEVLSQALSAVEVCIAALREQACDIDVDVANVLSRSVSDPICAMRDALEPKASNSDD